MPAVNVTIRVDQETKREFDAFCDNVGINITTAFHMYMKAVLRTRERVGRHAASIKNRGGPCEPP